MLAYLFWHRPRDGVDAGEYEEAQRSFLAELEGESACFRLDALPFGKGAGYEDWYLVEDWAALGVLNDAAIDAVRGPSHDRVAAMAGEGLGGVYRLVKGPAEIPAGADWLEKEPGRDSEEFIASLPARIVWRRQLVLGPAPEFCAATGASPGRERIWPR
jgi:hypothetical protein